MDWKLTLLHVSLFCVAHTIGLNFYISQKEAERVLGKCLQESFLMLTIHFYLMTVA